MKTSVYTKSDVVVAPFCILMIVLTAGAASQVNRDLMLRRTCASNLSSLGKAMLIYANDYDDELPKAGLRNNTWVPTLPNWMGGTRRQAYGITRNGSAKVTTTSSLYLLVKYAEAPVERFVCPAEPDTTPFKLDQVREPLVVGIELIDVWDFGGRYNAAHNPSTHCSYAYHMPFGRYALTVSNDPGVAVLADRNPWMDPNRVADPNVGWARFDPSASDPNKVRIGNSDAHQRDGQNVLYLDTHVSFQKRPNCGIDDDNIYTIASDTSEAGRMKGRPPRVYNQIEPLNRRDSMLVQEVGFDVPPIAPAPTKENGQ
jgi:hypothetical protein